MRSKSNVLLLLGALLILCFVSLVLFMPKGAGATVKRGEKLYWEQCMNCHGKDGKGLGKLIPGLHHAELLQKERLICAIRYGKSGVLEVGGVVYEGHMPPNFSLDDGEIRDIVNYVYAKFATDPLTLDLPEVQDQLRNCAQANPTLQW
jgi:cytochrome c551